MARIPREVNAEIENMPLIPESNQAHEWWVYSTAVNGRVLLVQCRNTKACGYVPNPTVEEWGKAFYAPSRPYPWGDDARVIVDPNTCPPFDEATKRAAFERSRGQCERDGKLGYRD